MTKEIIVTLANVWQMAPSDAQRKGVTTVSYPFPYLCFSLSLSFSTLQCINLPEMNLVHCSYVFLPACNYKGAIYNAGQSFTPDTCNTCWCMVDGSISCTEMQCFPGMAQVLHLLHVCINSLSLCLSLSCFPGTAKLSHKLHVFNK